MSMTTTPTFFDEKEMLAALKLSRDSFRKMLRREELPAPRMFGGSRRWPSTVLDDLAAGRAPWRDAKVA